LWWDINKTEHTGGSRVSPTLHPSFVSSIGSVVSEPGEDICCNGFVASDGL
jgi:hypothetical protein